MKIDEICDQIRTFMENTDKKFICLLETENRHSFLAQRISAGELTVSMIRALWDGLGDNDIDPYNRFEFIVMSALACLKPGDDVTDVTDNNERIQ